MIRSPVQKPCNFVCTVHLKIDIFTSVRAPFTTFTATYPPSACGLGTIKTTPCTAHKLQLLTSELKYGATELAHGNVGLLSTVVHWNKRQMTSSLKYETTGLALKYQTFD
jgi:hypothetical protein